MARAPEVTLGAGRDVKQAGTRGRPACNTLVHASTPPAGRCRSPRRIVAGWRTGYEQPPARRRRTAKRGVERDRVSGATTDHAAHGTRRCPACPAVFLAALLGKPAVAPSATLCSSPVVRRRATPEAESSEQKERCAAHLLPRPASLHAQRCDCQLAHWPDEAPVTGGNACRLDFDRASPPLTNCTV